MDISAASYLSGAGSPYSLGSIYAPSSASGTPSARSSSAIPTDASTGLPIVTRGQIELLSIRAMYEWNIQAVAALRGENVSALAFSASSRSSIEVVQALIQGASFQDANSLLGSSGASGSASGGYSGDLEGLLGSLLDFFSPASSALRLTDYGLSGDTASGGSAAGILGALSQGTQSAGAGAPSLLLIAMHRTEAYSLRYLDLYAQSGSSARAGSTDGSYTSYALSALGYDAYTSEDILIAYYGPGSYDSASPGYGGVNLWA